MLIGGQKVNSRDLDAVLQALNGLSSSVPLRTIRSTELAYLPGKAFDYMKQARAAQKKWKVTENNDDLEEALKYLQLAADENANDNQSILQADALKLYGEQCFDADDDVRGIPNLEKAIKIYTAHDCFDRLFDSVPILCSMIRETAKNREDEEAKGLWQKLRPLRQLLTQAKDRAKNQPVDHNAYRIAQREVGFSRDAQIGTCSVNDCACLIIWDPVTHKTALAHIDIFTDSSSLQLILDRMPMPSSKQPLQAKLVGARFAPGDGSDAKNVSESHLNLKRIADFLNDKWISVESATVQTLSQPTTIVVNPVDFSITEMVPGLEDPDAVIAEAHSQLDKANTPLRVAFDLTVSRSRKPILLDDLTVSLINTTGYEEKDIYAQVEEAEKVSNVAIQEILTEQKLVLWESHQKAVDDLNFALEEKIREWNLNPNNPSISNVDIDDARDAIARCAKYVGSGAKVANESIFDAIYQSMLAQLYDDALDKLFPVRSPLDPASIHPLFADATITIKKVGFSEQMRAIMTEWYPAANDDPNFFKNRAEEVGAEYQATLKGELPPSCRRLKVVRVSADQCYTPEEADALRNAMGIVPVDYDNQGVGRMGPAFAGSLLRTQEEVNSYIQKYGEEKYNDYCFPVVDDHDNDFGTVASFRGGNMAQYFNDQYPPTSLDGTLDVDVPRGQMIMVSVGLEIEVQRENKDPQICMIHMPHVFQHKPIPHGKQCALNYGPAFWLDRQRLQQRSSIVKSNHSPTIESAFKAGQKRKTSPLPDNYDQWVTNMNTAIESTGQLLRLRELANAKDVTYTWAKDNEEYSGALIGKLVDPDGGPLDGCVVFLQDPKDGAYNKDRPRLLLATPAQLIDSGIDPSKIQLDQSENKRYQSFTTANAVSYNSPIKRPKRAPKR